MSTQDIRKLSTVVNSIELIEEKTNILQSQYTTLLNENEHHQPILIDDSNVHLQLFFQHLEQLLQTDLKKSFLSNNNNNKRSYWNFFSQALKESKGLYDTVSYVLNSQEVKTPIGRGRLFLRCCLQSHCLGDVIQQSFMMTKIVNQFYIDECFWTSPTYMNRIIQALYQLTDLQFDLLSNFQHQLDVCWPTIEATEPPPVSLSDDAARMRNSSTSSFLSMNSVDSQLIVSVLPEGSNSGQITPKIFANIESSFNDDSSADSLSSVEENLENNNAIYWKEKYVELEIQLQELQSTKSLLSTNDIEIQCSIDENEKKENLNESIDKEIISQLNDENKQLKIDINLLNNKNEQLEIQMNTLNDKNSQLEIQINTLNDKNVQLKSNTNVLQEEINNLNFQLSSISMQRSTSKDKIKDYERDIAQYQSLIQNKDSLLNELQQKIDKQTNDLKLMEEKYLLHLNEQNKRIELLKIELEKSGKLLENERKSMEKERKELNKTQEQLEASLHEKTLDFEEMKRRLVKAIREKAELFNSIHSYEIKLGEEQSKKWIADEDVMNCMKCNIPFGWTVRKHHCRHCQKIFCNNCSNNWIQSQKTNTPQYRICDYCSEKASKDTSTRNTITHNNVSNDVETSDEVDLRFEVRSARLNANTTDSQSTS